MTKTITVSTLDELYDALSTAQGGETILLEGGDYGDFSLTGKSGFDTTFPTNVTIASADPSNPASFSSMDVRDSANLTFDGIVFDYVFEPGDEIWYRPFAISDSQNITIVNSTFDGDVASGVDEFSDGFGYAIGLSFRGCEGVVVENNEIYGFHRGASISESDSISVVNNDIHSLRSDGLNFSEVTDVLIEDNYIHDFAGSPGSTDHCDMIQFWTNGTDSPSTDITITGNILDIGDGTYTQSIFMRNDMVDRGLAGEEMYYQNIVITDNVITNAHSHGITVGETNGLTINNNTVLHADGGNPDGLDDSVEIPKINIAENSTNVVITQNATHSITGWQGQTDWVVANNAFVQDQDPDAVGYYGTEFISTTLQLIDGLHNYVALPGGMLDTLQAGAPSTLSPVNNQALDAQFQLSSSDDNAAVRSFDAAYTSTALGNDVPVGTTFEWDFGDGNSAQGERVSHAYQDGGIYEVSLTVTLPDGTTDTTSLSVSVQGPTLISMEQDGSFLAYENGVAFSLSDPAQEKTSGSVVTQEGIQLGAPGTAASIEKEHVSDIGGADDVVIDLTIRADSLTSSGELMQLPGSFILSVTTSGELHARIWTPAGEVKLTTSGAGLTDLETHDISVQITDEDIRILVDGEVLASANSSGGIVYTGAHDLYIGNPWSTPNFQGELLALEISANADDFEVNQNPDPEQEDPVDPPIILDPVEPVEPPIDSNPEEPGEGTEVPPTDLEPEEPGDMPIDPPTEPEREEPSNTPVDPPIESEPEDLEDPVEPEPAPEEEPDTSDPVDPAPPIKEKPGRPDFSFNDKAQVRDYLIQLFSQEGKDAKVEMVSDTEDAAYGADFEQQDYYPVESLSPTTTDDWLL